MRCQICKKEKDVGYFYQDKNKCYHSKCKECIKKIIDINNPFNNKDLFKEFDIPILENEWRRLAERRPDKNIFGRYLGKMKLKGYRGFAYADTEQINQFYRESEARTFQHINIFDLNINENIQYNISYYPQTNEYWVVRHETFKDREDGVVGHGEHFFFKGADREGKVEYQNGNIRYNGVTEEDV